MAQNRKLQSWTPERYAKHGGFVPELGFPVLELLDPQPGERILDLGCGDGVLSVKVMARGADVVGVDFSPEQVQGARESGVDARVMDGARLTFAAEFDAVISNAALHWMTADPDAVVNGVFRALRPGGRFAGEMGGVGNVESIARVLIRALEKRGIDGRSFIPWYFPAADEYAGKLENAGFEVKQINLIPRPTVLPGDLGGWIETFAENFLSALDPESRPGFVEEVSRELGPRLINDQGEWIADYVRLRFLAVKPA